MLLVDDILLLPARGFMGLLRKIAKAVDEEMTDEGKVKENLMRLQMLYETDQITEEEYDKRERAEMKRLEEIRIYKNQLNNPG
jgi:hypothetical protein